MRHPFDGIQAPQETVESTSPDRRTALVQMACGVAGLLGLQAQVQASNDAVPTTQAIHETGGYHLQTQKYGESGLAEPVLGPPSKLLHEDGVLATVQEKLLAIDRRSTTQAYGMGEDGRGPFTEASNEDGKRPRIATGALREDGLIHLAKAVQVPRPVAPATPIYSVAFSADGKTLAVPSEGNTIVLRDAGSWEASRKMTGHASDVVCAALAPDGRTMASASHDGLVRIWDTHTGKALRDLRGQGTPVSFVGYAADGKTLASAGHDGLIRLWDTREGKEIKLLRGHAGTVGSAIFSPDGKTLASGSHDTTIRVWDVASGKQLHQCQTGGAIERISFCPDGKLVAAANGTAAIQLWDAASGKRVRSLIGHSQEILHPLYAQQALQRQGDFQIAQAGGASTVAFSPDGSVLASGGLDQKLCLWEVATGALLLSIPAAHTSRHLVFSPNGRTLATAGMPETTAPLWDIATGRQGLLKNQREYSVDELEQLWTEFRNGTPAESHRAAWTLAASPEQSVKLFNQRLRPVVVIDEKGMERLLADLDHNRFQVRQSASAELERLGEVAVPALRRFVASRPSLEALRRAELILLRPSAESPPAELVMAIRATRVLQRIATTEARALLKKWAAGPAEAWLAQESATTCARMKRQQSV
ncbi:MAG: WD40 repeat domain-containing protein [Gemmataceae bacterium]|nr:WD40 repeat domain-containing protein [Gemmataceae bacterium]